MTCQQTHYNSHNKGVSLQPITTYQQAIKFIKAWHCISNAKEHVLFNIGDYVYSTIPEYKVIPGVISNVFTTGTRTAYEVVFPDRVHLYLRDRELRPYKRH